MYNNCERSPMQLTSEISTVSVILSSNQSLRQIRLQAAGAMHSPMHNI